MIDGKVKERERRVSIPSTRPLPSKGIKMDLSLEWRPIPPSWHQVVHGTTTRPLQESIQHKITDSSQSNNVPNEDSWASHLQSDPRAPGKWHTWPIRVTSQSLGLQVSLPSLHSRLNLTLLSSCVEAYGTNYNLINYGYARNIHPSLKHCFLEEPDFKISS